MYSFHNLDDQSDSEIALARELYDGLSRNSEFMSAVRAVSKLTISWILAVHDAMPSRSVPSVVSVLNRRPPGDPSKNDPMADLARSARVRDVPGALERALRKEWRLQIWGQGLSEHSMLGTFVERLRHFDQSALSLNDCSEILRLFCGAVAGVAGALGDNPGVLAVSIPHPNRSSDRITFPTPSEMDQARAAHRIEYDGAAFKGEVRARYLMWTKEHKTRRGSRSAASEGDCELNHDGVNWAIDRIFGLPPGSDLSATTADTMWGLQTLAGLLYPDPRSRPAIWRLLYLLPIAAMVAYYHHTIFEADQAATLARALSQLTRELYTEDFQRHKLKPQAVQELIEKLSGADGASHMEEGEQMCRRLQTTPYTLRALELAGRLRRTMATMSKRDFAEIAKKPEEIGALLKRLEHLPDAQVVHEADVLVRFMDSVYMDEVDELSDDIATDVGSYYRKLQADPGLSEALSERPRPPLLRQERGLTRPHIRGVHPVLEKLKPLIEENQKDGVNLNARLLEYQLRLSSAEQKDIRWDQVVAGGNTVRDLMGIAGSLNSIILSATDPSGYDPTSWDNFMTYSDWAALFAPIASILSIGNMLRGWYNAAEGEVDKKQALKDTGQVLLGAGAAATQLAASAGGGTLGLFRHGFIPNGTASLSAGVVSNLGFANIGLGMISGLVTLYNESHNLEGLLSIEQRYDDAVRRNPNLAAFMDSSLSLSAFKKQLIKIKRRKLRSRINEVGGVSSIGASITTVVVLAGAAGAMATPFGWALAGVATLAALGSVTYSGCRKIYKMGKLSKLRARLRRERSSEWIPPWIRTTGEYYRFRVAYFIHSCVAPGPPTLDERMVRLGKLFAYILWGESNEKAEEQARKAGIAGIMKYLKG